LHINLKGVYLISSNTIDSKNKFQMKPYGYEYYLTKNPSYRSQRNSKNISQSNLNLSHKIFDTINFSLLILILILSFLSFDSQRKWSNTYRVLSKLKVNNNNLIDYISKTEEFYITKFESLNTLKKTTPKDLIYLDRITKEKENLFKKQIINIVDGLKDSKYQRGY